jgi:hypothetical protein
MIYRIKIQRGAQVELWVPAESRIQTARLIHDLAMVYDDDTTTTKIVSIHEDPDAVLNSPV